MVQVKPEHAREQIERIAKSVAGTLDVHLRVHTKPNALEPIDLVVEVEALIRKRLLEMNGLS